MEAFVKYTVKQLANYSGVSARTLRFYDKIGLLSPAYYAENGYRYYGKKELLNLQQILFFRELGFKLSDIKTIVTQNEFDRVKSLQKHKIYLLEKIQEFKTLRGPLLGKETRNIRIYRKIDESSESKKIR